MKTHKIPIDTLVEVKFTREFSEGACEAVHARLFVIGHERNLQYVLSRVKNKDIENAMKELGINRKRAEMFFGRPDRGFVEEDLTPIKITPEIEGGENNLEI